MTNSAATDQPKRIVYFEFDPSSGEWRVCDFYGHAQVDDGGRLIMFDSKETHTVVIASGFWAWVEAWSEDEE